ncbi:hypothetical protein B0A55_00496 [Friedmanniomyces simplex]|uniref:Major facilitator superfamily (MFS) profile domain-containing protein n=1 Tax=Friedmanniomyces simplex TaxID=329884 RepID=A0A4U0XZM4_9PEZI|nr:hypothetical protein B0A55_00496 [Friedmanniomyces simplex]
MMALHHDEVDHVPHRRHRTTEDVSSNDADSIAGVPDDVFDANDQGLVDSPLLRLRPEEVDNLTKHFVRRYHLENHEEVFLKAGKVLRDPEASMSVPRLTPEEKEALKNETSSGFWKQPKQLQVTIITLCVAAVVQGWNQTGTNGANLNWPQQLGLLNLQGCDPTGIDAWKFSIVNAATYLSASLVGCWLSDPLNEYFFGRRAAICLSAVIILASAIGGACTRTWQELLVSRILLGLGMGCKASVVPVFAAEISPAHIRGSLVMNWQLFDAFGVFCGFTANLVVSQVGPTAWRWQVASSALPTIVLLSLIYVCPESPRFLMRRGYYRRAYQNLILLRFHPILAAKELLYVHCQMEVESRFLGEVTKSPAGDEGKKRTSKLASTFRRHSAAARPVNYWRKLYQLFSIKRNQRAITAAMVCMIGQQLCGVNALQFFSSTFFCDARGQEQKDNNVLANSSYLQPLFLSWGIGLANFLFTFPAYYFIDRKGRRWLLLVTIPLMAVTSLAAGLSFLMSTSNSARTPVIALFTFLFMAAYSSGIGPVPFTLSAEVFPMEHRMVCMSFAVFTNLFGAGVLALFVPALTNAIGHVGLLGVFAGLNVLAFILVFFFVRETAGAAVGGGAFGNMISVSLEELNYIFGVPAAKHAIYQWKTVLPWAWQYYILRDKECPDQPEKLYTWASAHNQEKHEVPKTV